MPILKTLWPLFEQGHIKKLIAQDNYQSSWKHLSKAFGNLTEKRITQDWIDAYVAERDARPATIRRELAHFKAFLNWCAEPRRKLIDQVPDFDLPPDSPPRDYWLRSIELARLLKVCKTDENAHSSLYIFVALAAYTAARKEAICQLTWDRVDFETGAICYDVPGRIKTKKRRACVPMSTDLRAILTERFDYLRPKPADLVIGNFNACYELGKITKANNMTKISPHVLRHTAATLMARKGVPLWQIAGVLGNTTAMVEKVYAKHSPDGLQNAVNAI